MSNSQCYYIEICVLIFACVLGVAVCSPWPCLEGCRCTPNILNCSSTSGEHNSAPLFTEVPTSLSLGGEFGQISAIDFSRNKIRQISEYDLSGCDSVREISLSRNDIDVILPNTFTSVENTLQYLDLSHNKISYIGPNSLSSSQTSSQLLALNLAHNRIHSITNAMFSHLSRLRELVLDGNVVRNVDADSFIAMSDLQVLSLSHTQFSPRLYKRALTTLVNLKAVYLTGNMFPCDCSWLQIVELWNARGVETHGLKQMPYCSQTIVSACQRLGRDNDEPLKLLAQELEPPELDEGKLIVNGIRYEPRSFRGQEMFWLHYIQVQRWIAEIPDEENRLYVSRLFHDRMRQFYDENISRELGRYDDGPGGFDYFPVRDRKSGLQSEHVVIIAVSSAILVIVVAAAVILHLLDDRDDFKMKFKTCCSDISCMRLLRFLRSKTPEVGPLLKKSTRQKEGKTYKKVNFHEIHNNVSPQSNFKMKKMLNTKSDGSGEDDWESELKLSISNQRRKSLGGSQEYSSLSDEEDDDLEVYSIPSLTKDSHQSQTPPPSPQSP